MISGAIQAEPDIAANRHSSPRPHCLAFPQDRHDPQIGRSLASPSISCIRPHAIGPLCFSGSIPPCVVPSRYMPTTNTTDAASKLARFNDGRFRVIAEANLRPLARFGCSIIGATADAVHRAGYPFPVWPVVDGSPGNPGSLISLGFASTFDYRGGVDAKLG